MHTIARHQLRRLVGHVVSYFMVCRAGLSTLRVCYDILEQGSMEDRVPISADLAGELRVVKGLLCLTETTFFKIPCPIVLCSDASQKGYALHATRATEHEVRKLAKTPERARFIYHDEHEPPDDFAFRGQVAGPRRDEDDLPLPPASSIRRQPRVRRMAVEHSIAPVDDEMVVPERWVRLLYGAWKSGGTIHSFEARGMLHGLRQVASLGLAHGRLLMSLGDNMSAILAMEKGRATAYDLLAQTRRAAAYIFAAEIDWRCRWVDTVRNISDWDSRAANRGEIGVGLARDSSKSLELVWPEICEPVLQANTPFSPHRPPGVFYPGGATPLSILATGSSMWSVSPTAAGHLPVLPPPGLGAVVAGDASARPGQSTSSTLSSSSTRPSATSGTISSSQGGVALAGASRDATVGVGTTTVTRRPPAPPLPAPSPPREQRRCRTPGRRGHLLQRPFSRPLDQSMLEVFAGEGSLTAACSEVGLRVACPIDIAGGHEFDITNPAIQSLIIRWVRKGRFWLVHLAPPCTGWSVARKGKQLASSVETASFTVRLVRAARLSGTHITLENPRASRLFSWPPLARQFELSRLQPVHMCYCSFGAPYKKPTTFLSSVPALCQIGSTCACRGPHQERLQGLVELPTGWCWKTSLASFYPPRLARKYAAAVLEEAPACSWRRPQEPVLDKSWQQTLAAEAKVAISTECRVKCLAHRYRLPWRGCRRRLEPSRTTKVSPCSAQAGAARKR